MQKHSRVVILFAQLHYNKTIDDDDNVKACHHPPPLLLLLFAFCAEL